MGGYAVYWEFNRIQAKRCWNAYQMHFLLTECWPGAILVWAVESSGLGWLMLYCCLIAVVWAVMMPNGSLCA
ncbi:hypothetical protein Nepgr_017393 [Nepenthes gracilis]|uniref:Uncharacterized protein n=1 Tax=Nepenthes gracilis TaxID=150966 RepID=A0AAD3XS44_NEPGR|nr:hypothetical protein Nepgr_017393 [Nepenthes gracilis]